MKIRCFISLFSKNVFAPVDIIYNIKFKAYQGNLREIREFFILKAMNQGKSERTFILITK